MCKMQVEKLLSVKQAFFSLHACVFLYGIVCVLCVCVLFASRQVKWSGGKGVSQCNEGHHRGRPGTDATVCVVVWSLFAADALFTSDATFADPLDTLCVPHSSLAFFVLKPWFISLAWTQRAWLRAASVAFHGHNSTGFSQFLGYYNPIN